MRTKAGRVFVALFKLSWKCVRPQMQIFAALQMSKNDWESVKKIDLGIKIFNEYTNSLIQNLQIMRTVN